MKRYLCLIPGLLLLSPLATAADRNLESCIAAIGQQKPGAMVKLEKVRGDNKTLYEFEIRDVNGFQWEFMCDAENGKIVEMESEVRSPESLSFRQGRRYTEEDAASIALKRFPGRIEEVEYEIEENGDPSYEFDIVDAQGKETKVEVSATNGKIIEIWQEDWEIGEEPEERR